jgi:hypothetical protein
MLELLSLSGEISMGLFCANFHVRDSEAASVSKILAENQITHCHVLPAKHGWTSFYEKRASDQDDTRIQDLAALVSGQRETTVVAFMVHDSDIACYWLYDHGVLRDAFNSFPDYFEDVATRSGPDGGRPDILAKYCRPGVTLEHVSSILTDEDTFAEQLIERLAEALGIDRERAITDYRHMEDGEGPDGYGEGGDFGSGGDGDWGGDGDRPNGMLDDTEVDSDHPQILSMWSRSLGKAKLPFKKEKTPADDLVHAAVNDNLTQIEALLEAGAAIDAEGTAPPPEKMASVSAMLPMGTLSMTPLLAAVLHSRFRAAQFLLAKGANPNYPHVLFGSPIHSAVGGGDVQMVQLLLQHGADATRRNQQGLTPMQTLATARSAWSRMQELRTTARSCGMKLPEIFGRLPVLESLEGSWKACERILQDVANAEK